MICPDCKGSKEIVAAHVTYANGRSGWGVPFPCHRCNGTGEVPEEMAEWMREGRAMRDARVNGKPYRSQRDEAKRRGMTAMQLSAMEMGRVKPVPDTDDIEEMYQDVGGES